MIVNYLSSSTAQRKLLNTHLCASHQLGQEECITAAGPPLRAWVVLTWSPVPARISLSLSSGLAFCEGWWALPIPKTYSTTERIQTSPWEELPALWEEGKG